VSDTSIQSEERSPLKTDSVERSDAERPNIPADKQEPVDSKIAPSGDSRRKLLARSLDTILGLASHTVVMILCLGSIWLIHFALTKLLGSDARFFDLIPVRYIIEVGDLIVIGKFLWELIKDFRGGD
jgi:hypothetical protein